MIYVLSLVIFLQWLRVIREAFAFDQKSRAFYASPSLALGSVESVPLVTVIVPARNEERDVEQGLRSLLQQTYSNLEVIAVNDRSIDQTGTIMESVARESGGRIRVLHIHELPERWLGKNHALHLGAQTARGDILLFTDGDVRFAPGAIGKAVGALRSFNLDHLVLAPRFTAGTTMLAALQLFFGLVFLSETRPSRIGRSKDAYLGAGAFNLVRKEAYLKSGGHERLRLEIIDDVMLGKILVQSGARQMAADGQEYLEVHWYRTADEMIRGLEKNGFAAMRYSYWNLLVLVTKTFVFHLLPYSLLTIASGGEFWVLAGVMVFAHVLYAVAAHQMKYRVWISFLVPIAAWVLCFAFVRSAWIAIRRGRVAWRETSYSLEELRANQV